MKGLRRPPLRVWIWTAATLALVVVAALLWRGSDAAATESTTSAPADAPSGTPAGALSRAWSASGDPVPDSVVQGDRVILGSAHGVRALDVATGRPAWHYTRSNARLCGLTAVDGLAVAVFRTADLCDEAVALHAGTGVRAWTRSLRLRPDVTLTSTDRIVLAASPTGVLTFDPAGDNIRWRYHAPAGCRLLDAAAGNSGVAVLQRCAGSPTVRVRLLDGFSGDPHWTRDLPLPEGAPAGAVPSLVGAEHLVAVVVGPELQLLRGTDGAVATTLPATGSTEPAETEAGGIVLVWADGVLTAVDAGTDALLWQQPALGLPSVPDVGKSVVGPAWVLVPEDGGFVQRGLTTGAEQARATVDGLRPGGTATAIGPVVVYRLPDRVTGYR